MPRRRRYARHRDRLTKSAHSACRQGQPPVDPRRLTVLKRDRQCPVLRSGRRCFIQAHPPRLTGRFTPAWRRDVGAWALVHFGFLVGCILLTLGMLAPDTVRPTCGRQCDASYSTDIDNCRLQYSDDPADADDLTNCVQEAKDDYRRCLDDCNCLGIKVFAVRFTCQKFLK
jgi:hypothetical protein